ncbi:hypothetical protein BT67DRAFT_7223 [Trichocladium antarcticum]|uniref:Uncharacterized protein n=1 Tax=Trichocladium antarcticum TaxID=1450529 RepID=A0AAN6USZ6_9PEZI|nr:hypothetical protein BT67DRAFT_7223 [Trichocladium antarcticum]
MHIRIPQVTHIIPMLGSLPPCTQGLVHSNASPAIGLAKKYGGELELTMEFRQGVTQAASMMSDATTNHVDSIHNHQVVVLPCHYKAQRFSHRSPGANICAVWRCALRTGTSDSFRGLCKWQIQQRQGGFSSWASSTPPSTNKCHGLPDLLPELSCQMSCQMSRVLDVYVSHPDIDRCHVV